MGLLCNAVLLRKSYYVPFGLEQMMRVMRYYGINVLRLFPIIAETGEFCILIRLFFKKQIERGNYYGKYKNGLKLNRAKLHKYRKSRY